MVDFLISPQTDEPKGETEYLGIDITCTNLINFLESDKIVTPMSIAVHGVWGSGKTNLLHALKKNLDSSKNHITFFEAWKHESGNPSVALISKIAYELAETYDHAVEIITTVGNALVRTTTGVNPKEIINAFRSKYDSIESLSEQLEKNIKNKLGNRKLIVLIDDLDRCDVENTLMILALMKLFLSIPNCVCIAAIDFHRVEQAWFAKYGIKDGQLPSYEKEGRQYLEKIFQIRIPIPYPNDDERTKFLQDLLKGIPNELIKLFVENGPVNPRAIKRLINLISYRSFNTISDDGETISFLWTLLEENISSKNISILYENMEAEDGFVKNILKLQDKGYWPKFTDFFEKTDQKLLSEKYQNDYGEEFFFKFSALLQKMKSAPGRINIDFDRLYLTGKEIQNF